MQPRGTGAGQADHHDRVRQVAVENLGMTPQQILRIEPMLEQSQDVGAIHEAADRIQVSLSLQRLDQQLHGRHEVGAAEVLQPRFTPGAGYQGICVQVEPGQAHRAGRPEDAIEHADRSAVIVACL